MERDALHFDDPLARAFLTPKYAAMFHMRFLAKPILMRRMPGTYLFVLARSRFFDQALRDALHDGATQVVLLGAGFDTRPYRIPFGPNVRVFEVDAPPTSARKLARVMQLFGRRPEHVAYVPVDFERGDLATALEKSGYRADQQTFFLWEGVTFYLDGAAVSEVLRFVATQCPGSSVAFDHLYADVVVGPSERFGARESAAFVARQGEPFRWGMVEGDEARFVADLGLECVRSVGPEAMHSELLPGLSALGGGPPEIYGLLLARVPRR